MLISREILPFFLFVVAVVLSCYCSGYSAKTSDKDRVFRLKRARHLLIPAAYPQEIYGGFRDAMD